MYFLVTAKQKFKSESEKGRRKENKGGNILKASKVQNYDGHCARLRAILLTWSRVTSLKHPF